MSKIKTEADFIKFVEKIRNKKKYKDPIAFGVARVDKGQLDRTKTLQATYPVINWEENYGSAAVFIAALEECGEKVDFSQSEQVFTIKRKWLKATIEKFKPFLEIASGNLHKNIQVIKHLSQEPKDLIIGDNYRITFIFEDVAPLSVESLYLKLYALSTCKKDIGSLNLQGAFGLLENVAWSGGIPVELDWLRENELAFKLDGIMPQIDYIDKFPRYLQHIIPADNTRILDSSRVRMGARLEAGTTVMPGASYINFNAGTKGAVMVEGRISSSASVGKGSDIGGGASILGVLSGTNGNPITIGENTLLGANSVTGIPIGDGCIVDAGLSVLEGTKIYIDDANFKSLKEINPKLKESNTKIYKGLELSGINGAHFRQDSQKGRIIAIRSKREVKLNADLH